MINARVVIYEVEDFSQDIFYAISKDMDARVPCYLKDWKKKLKPENLKEGIVVRAFTDDIYNGDTSPYLYGWNITQVL